LEDFIAMSLKPNAKSRFNSTTQSPYPQQRSQMANQQTTDSGRFSVPFFDFAGFLTKTAKQNSRLGPTMQALGKEWTDFVEARLREDSQFFQTLVECKGLPDMQRAYVQFWGKALSQYEEETQRLVRIAQGAMEESAQVAQESIEGARGRRASNG
jgi:Phasin protein